VTTERCDSDDPRDMPSEGKISLDNTYIYIYTYIDCYYTIIHRQNRF
jgi:hypothetical protein